MVGNKVPSIPSVSISNLGTAKQSLEWNKFSKEGKTTGEHETSIGWRSFYHPNVRVEREKRSASPRRFLLHRCDSSGATLGVTWLKPSNTETGKSNRVTYAGSVPKGTPPTPETFPFRLEHQGWNWSTRTNFMFSHLLPKTEAVATTSSKMRSQQTSNKANKILRLLGNFTLGLKYCIL